MPSTTENRKLATASRVMRRVGTYGKLYPRQSNDEAQKLLVSNHPIGSLALFLGDNPGAQTDLLAELGKLTGPNNERLNVSVIAGAEDRTLVDPQGLAIAGAALYLVRKFAPLRDEACYPVLKALGQYPRIDLSTESFSTRSSSSATVNYPSGY